MNEPSLPTEDKSSADPIVRLFNESRSLRAYVNDPNASGVMANAAVERLADIDVEIRSAKAASLEGAIAALQWAVMEFREFYGPDEAGDSLVLVLVESALKHLEQQSGEPRDVATTLRSPPERAEDSQRGAVAELVQNLRRMF